MIQGTQGYFQQDRVISNVQKYLRTQDAAKRSN